MTSYSEFSELETIILGNFNTDVLKHTNTCVLVKSLNNVLNFMNVTQLITEPTRCTVSSATAIDFILVSDSSRILQSGAVRIGISDHYLTFCSMKLRRRDTHSNDHNTVNLRSMKNYTKVIFQEILSTVDWMPVLYCDNVTEAWSIFKTSFMSVIYEIAPLKQTRMKTRTEPWMSSELLDLIQKSDKLCEKF